MWNHESIAMPTAPDDQAALITAARALSTAGQFGRALAMLMDALARRPDDPELLLERASTLFDWGRVREAREQFVRAQACGIDRLALHLNLAWTCHLLGSVDEAERHARKAIEIDADSVPAHFRLGAILQRRGRHAEAVASFARVLERAPEHVDAILSTCVCKLEERDYVAAEIYARRALDVESCRPEPWANLAAALLNQERYSEAIDAYRRAEEIGAEHGEAIDSFVNHGYALILTGATEAAAALYRKHLPARPSPSGHRQYAFALLGLGRFVEGWDQYEFRWLQEPHLSNRPRFAQPPWIGQDLNGRTILLRAEQGAGDIIQFARFAQLLKSMGAAVLLQVPKELRRLSSRFAGVDRVLGPDDQRPPFDYYVHMMSVPRVLGTELATVPAVVPYLSADPVKVSQWAVRIDEPSIKIGLAWAGNPAHARDRYRSVPFATLSPLFDVEGVRYFSLQKEPRTGERDAFPPEATMVDLSRALTDFDDTAAAIANLDVVVCVDTAIAHLAAALGKPTWLLLPAIGDFRWLEGRNDSPWYPTMRLFRQVRLGEWGEVVAQVKAALQDAVCKGCFAVPSLATPPTKLVLPGHGSAEWLSALGHQPPLPRDLARVAETRHGILQYMPDADDAARSLEWYGEYLQAHLELLARAIRPGAQILEVGSGIGAHAIPLAKLAGVDGHLFIYESRAIPQRLLRQNLDASHVAHVVTVMRGELGGPGPAKDHEPCVGANGSDAAGGSEDANGRETIDELLLERLDLIKIHQHIPATQILAGAAATLWRTRPVLFIGVPDTCELSAISELAKTFGYRCWQLDTPLHQTCNFYRREVDNFAGKVAIVLLAIPEESDPSIVPDGCDEILGTCGDATGDHRRDVQGGHRDTPIAMSVGLSRPGFLRSMCRRFFRAKE